jgi:hypothetical protein
MNQVLIITGTARAGKTSVSARPRERFDRMVHIPVDDLRHWVRAGYRHPWAGDAQSAEQLRMAADSAVRGGAQRRRLSLLGDHRRCRRRRRRRGVPQSGLAGLEAQVQFVTLLPSLDTMPRARRAPYGPASIPDRVRVLHAEFTGRRSARSDRPAPSSTRPTTATRTSPPTGCRTRSQGASRSSGRRIYVGAIRNPQDERRARLLPGPSFHRIPSDWSGESRIGA